MTGTDGKNYEQLLKQALPALQSKKSELISLGYEDVTVQLIVDCLLENNWKRKRPTNIHKIVQHILNLKPSVYMTFMTSNAYTLDDDLMSSITAITGQNEDKT